MNEHELEQRLRAWHHADVEESVVAPRSLRAAVSAIPATMTSPRSSWWRRRPTLLAAAVLAAGALGGALAVGSGVLRIPSEPPRPPTNAVTATPTPAAPPQGSPDPSQATTPEISPQPTPRPVAQSGFQSIAAMTTPRYLHTATLLPDGRVLIIGGSSVLGGVLGTTQIWDPATERFTPAAPLLAARAAHAATLLADGRVLIVGGVDADGRGNRALELWDPATETFRPAGLMTERRGFGHSATLLSDGRVLIVGGIDCGLRSQEPNDEARAACLRHLDAGGAVIWDPATESVTPAGPAADPRAWNSATLLDDGRVLVVGGLHLPTIGAEVWDPTTGSWSGAGSPADVRTFGHRTTRLLDGRVLVVGGQTAELSGDVTSPGPLGSAEVWDPETGSFSSAGIMALVRDRHTATLLPDGRVLVVGGLGELAADGSAVSIREAEIWSSATTSFVSAGLAGDGRALHTATLLQDGRVLITGGFTREEQAEIVGDLASAELWAP